MADDSGMDLAAQLEEARKEIDYYKRLTREAGNIRLRETEELSSLIGELRKTKGELSEHLSMIEGILTHAAEGICVCHNVDKYPFVIFTHWNIRMSEITGYSMDEINRLGWYQTLYPDPEIQSMVVERMSRMREGDDLRAEEWVITTKAGQQRTVSISTSVLKDSKGEAHVLSVMQDITDRKQAEQERENLRAQLLQSQKMETMGTLATGIVHDFNNMLQVIFGYSDMLLAHMNKGDPGYEGLQKILRTSQDAADLVQRIRIFGRKAVMNLVPLDLNHQVDEVTKLLSHTIPKMIDIEIHLTKDPVIIKADSSQIAQMVMNLAVNANEAMPQGGRLSIQTENIVLDDDYCRPHVGVKPGPHVMLTVSDTGRGIDKSLMERIFDPFYSTKTRDYHKGTGLGLSVVQGIVQQHGGHITVESEVGQGTTFRMYFPALEHEILPEYVETKIPYPAGVRKPFSWLRTWKW